MDMFPGMPRILKIGIIILMFTSIFPIIIGFGEFENDALDSDFDDGDIYNHRMNETFRMTIGGVPASFDIYDANVDGNLEFIVLSQSGFYVFSHDGEDLTHLVGLAECGQ